MWNSSISLPVKKHTVQDSEGFPTEQWEFLGGIPANILDATRQDAILANQSGYEASVIVEIMTGNYNGASFFVDEATREVYDIRRTFHPDKSTMIQLTGERRERGTI